MGIIVINLAGSSPWYNRQFSCVHGFPQSSFSKEQRIDTLLIKDARERLSGVVEFVRSELEKPTRR
jgi:hypothetical protein